MKNKAQIVYFGHGGGPLPILGDPGHKSMLDFLGRLPAMLEKPEAILVISAHWEETAATLLGAENPSMFYDYYGFPPQAYEIQYPAPGNPDLASKIAAELERHHIPARIDPERGYDHGLFIPLKMMYPKADIPCLQLSLLRGLNPGAHIALGNALRPFLSENILVVGSGFSFHNMGAFRWQGSGQADAANDLFQDWLIDVCTGDTTQTERERRMTAWAEHPSARYCHPREEHLLPLHVCLGMAESPAKLVFDDRILDKRNVGFLWKNE
jgi:4,5-DOPA dioxygenase extradiol